MKTAYKVQQHRRISILLIGILIALIITIAGAACLSAVIWNGTIDENNAIYAVAPIQLISAATGSYVAARRCGKRYILHAMIVSAAYYLVIVTATLLVFDCYFVDIGVGTIMCVIGGVLAGCLCLALRRKNGYKKRML